MHQALLIPEVFLEIIAHVNQIQNPSSTAEKALARKSIAALATTCKTFHEPAMDLLWSKVDQLEPLLGCVTRLHPLVYHNGSRWRNTWSKGIEPLSTYEARQFLCHSSRIRSLNVQSDHFFSPSLSHPRRGVRLLGLAVVDLEAFHWKIFEPIPVPHAAPLFPIYHQSRSEEYRDALCCFGGPLHQKIKF